MNFGEKVKQLRTERNLTQPQLAQAIGIEQSYLSKLENDKSVPSADIFQAILKAFGIDVATWFFEDRSFTNELIARWQAGVPVRVIGDPDANVQHPLNKTLLNELAAAKIPVRHKVSSGIEHWKMMLFAGQNVVYFGSANFSADAFVPADDYKNFVDETIYLTDDDSVVATFKTRFEDAWVNTTAWANYANAPNSRKRTHCRWWKASSAANTSSAARPCRTALIAPFMNIGDTYSNVMDAVSRTMKPPSAPM